ncbi:hypothetical protein IQ02_00660 [Flavobacterium glaciei]|uniref:Uncharacterized protein n=1 Tax=Flavobacterium glaciei TaxID=386300 RepID=A0A562Q270_9FLAO|nr:hypothetical protein DFR66_10256 [Flavobacterium glaciei]TWI50754.1 hypothetical protein IQ02_00660 [Flavobacterium glaciei]
MFNLINISLSGYYNLIVKFINLGESLSLNFNYFQTIIGCHI